MASKAAMQAAAKELRELCAARGVKLPAKDAGPIVGAALMGTKTAAGEVDLNAALLQLSKTYGGDAALLAEAAPPVDETEEKILDANPKKRKAKEAAESKKKAKEEELAALPNLNPELVELFNEASKQAFDEKDTFKGVNLKKVAHAMRECPFVITSGKQVSAGKQKLVGVGKGSGDRIQAYLDEKKAAAKAAE